MHFYNCGVGDAARLGDARTHQWRGETSAIVDRFELTPLLVGNPSLTEGPGGIEFMNEGRAGSLNRGKHNRAVHQRCVLKEWRNWGRGITYRIPGRRRVNTERVGHAQFTLAGQARR